MFTITGDTHAERARFTYRNSAMDTHLLKGDYLFVCGDFGYIFDDDERERDFLDYMARKPYTICFVDGNHENFDVINSFPIEEWCGGKVHVIRRDKEGNPKIIHLMRGQVYEVKDRDMGVKKIFTYGGAYSIDKALRIPGRSWWQQEMPSDEEMKEGIHNLKKHDYKVDYIITHAAPEETMNIFHPNHEHEKPLNNFLEWVRENVEYKHWYMGHLHRDEDVWRHQTILWFDVRNMENNEQLDEGIVEE